MATDFRINIYGQLDPKTKTNIQSQLKTISSQMKVDIKANTNFANVNKDIKNSTKNTSKLNDEFKTVNKTSTKMAQDFKSGFIYEMGIAIQRTIEWTIAVGGLYSVIRKVQDSIQFIKDIDVELTTIAMVTGQTREQVQGLTKDYTELSKELKANTLDVTKSAVALYRHGLNAEEVEERLRQIAMAAKVAGISVEEATTYVTVGVNAMKVSSQEFNDVLVKVSSNAATNYEKIAISFQKSAASFRNANVELERAAAYMATVQEVSQLSPQTVGAAFKTIIARFSKVTQEGMDNSEVLNSIVKALKEVGINAIGADDQLRDLGDILDELSGKWETLEKKERDRLKTEIAGVRRGDIFLTLMDNYSRSLELYDIALNSNGETLQQYEKYVQSVEAAQTDLANTWKELATIMIESEQIQGFYNIMTDLVDVLIKVENTFGLLNTAIMIATLSLLKFKSAMIINIITEFVAAIQLAMGALTSLAGVADLAAISLSALWPLLAAGAVLYGIKRLRDYNKELDKTNKAAKDLKKELRELNSNDMSGLKDAVEGIDISFVNNELEKLNSKLYNLQVQNIGGIFDEEIAAIKEDIKYWQDLSSEYEKANNLIAENQKNMLNEMRWASLEGSVEDYADSIETLTRRLKAHYELVTDAAEEQDILNVALDEMNETGHLSQQTYEDLIKMDEKYINILSLEKGAIIDLLEVSLNKSKESVKAARIETQEKLRFAKSRIKATKEEMKSLEQDTMALMMRAQTTEERDRAKEALSILQMSDTNEALELIEQYEAELNTIDNTLAMFSETTEDVETSVSATTQELEKFYDQLRAISDAKYLLDMAETSEEQKIAIEKLVSALKSYNSELKIEISRLDSLVDVTDGISSAEVEHINARDELIDVLRSNNIEIKNLQSSYEELQKVEKKSVEELQSIIKEVESQFVEMIRKREELQREANEEWFKDESEAYKKAHEDKMDFYDAELDAFKNMIDDKKQALKDQFDEEDYQEELAGLRREEADIQSQINILKLRDDVEAKAKTIELEKDLADKRTEISDLQRDHERDALLDNLDKQLDEQEDYYDNLKSEEEKKLEIKLDTLKDEYDANVAHLDDMYTKEKVYAEARKMLLKGNIQEIKEAYQSFENEFGEGLSYLGDTVIEDFISKLKEARDAIKSLEGAKMPSAGAGGSGGGGTTGGATETDIMTSDGIKTKGYIIGGKTYYDPEGKSRVDPGTYVDTAAGTYVLKDDGTGEKVSDSKIIGSYETGTTSVPKDGLAYIHEGEAIIPKNFNPFNIKNNSSFVSNVKDGLLSSLTGKMGSSSYDISINVAGSLDRDSIPNLKSAIKDVINEKDREKYRRNKKIGVYNY